MTGIIRRVVVGIDDSAASEAALRRAAHMARTHHAQLHPVLIYSSPEGDYIDLVWPPDPATAREQAERARGRLASACGRALDGTADDLELTPTVVRGQKGPGLVASACEEGDVLVVGDNRHGLWHRMLLGSVSRYCAHHARCPLMVVPADERPCHARVADRHQARAHDRQE